MQVTARVLNIENKPTAKGYVHEVKLSNGRTYSTFKEEVVEGLEVGMTIDAEVSEGKNSRGYDAFYLNSWSAVPGAPQADTPPSVPTEVWEAKDRAIAMESAYSSAARYMQAVAVAGDKDLVTGANFIKLARTIYADVQKARHGFDLSEERAGRDKEPEKSTGEKHEEMPFTRSPSGTLY